MQEYVRTNINKEECDDRLNLTVQIIDYLVNSSVFVKNYKVLVDLVEKLMPELEKDTDKFNSIMTKIKLLLNECYTI